MSALASVTSLANCSSPLAPDQSAAPEPDLGVVRSVSSVADIILPLDAYYLSEDEDLLLQRVERTLIGDCMRRFGVEYRADPPYPAGATPHHKRLFGVVDAAEGASFGYHGSADDAVDSDKEAQVRANSPKMSEAAERILTGTEDPRGDGQLVPVGGGVPDHGCGGEAQRKLTDGVSGAANVLDPNYLQSLGGSSGVNPERDSRVQAAFRDWSACMKGRGFSYATPWDANNDPAWATDRPNAREKATATADVACKRQTKLTDIWLAVTVAYQKRAIESHATELLAYTKAKQEQLARAARLAAEK
jgi:hypothetical protein